MYDNEVIVRVFIMKRTKGIADHAVCREVCFFQLYLLTAGQLRWIDRCAADKHFNGNLPR